MNANSSPEGQQSPKANGNGGNRRNAPEQPLNLRHYLPIGAAFLAAAPIALVVFPLFALKITADADCCFDDSPSDLMTFWGAVLAGMLALFGLLISGIYIFTAFKIDIGAKKAARDQAWETAERVAPGAAQDAAMSFYEKYRKRELANLKSVLDEHLERTSEHSEFVNKALDKARAKAESVMKLAESSQSGMENSVASFNQAASEKRGEMDERASGIRDLAIASEANINSVVDGVKRAAKNAEDAADAAQRAAQKAKEFSDEANLGGVVDQAKEASEKAAEAARSAEQSAQKAKQSADEAERHARRASGGDPAPESA